jgi:hypothetical protein
MRTAVVLRDAIEKEKYSQLMKKVGSLIERQ